MAATDIIEYLNAHSELSQFPTGAKILDFGCGKGDLVAEFRRLGFDAYGVDVSMLWKDELNEVCYTFHPGYRIPFEDGEFDLVVSTSVMYHVQNKHEAFLEICRILKSGGYAVHAFPSKFYLPLEPHVGVPFVSWFKRQVPVFYLTLFALIGFKNVHQSRLSWREVRDENIAYIKNGLSYWSRRRYLDSLASIYKEVIFDPAYAACGGGAVARIDQKIKNQGLRQVWRQVATLFRNQLLLCKK